MIKISKDDKVYNIITKYPDVKNIMEELGFKDIVKPGMLQSVGRIMSIQKGTNIKNLELDKVREVFLTYGYILD